jgi:hypothetical protein
MSDLTFEILPNEMLIEVFEYLNAVDIFYSFDQLNSRFNKLIRSIPLHLNLQYVRKSIFDRFCTKMLSNPEIKNQIISLKLSNQDTCSQIDTFVSLFSLDEFSNLQSLILDRVPYNENGKKIHSMLFLIPNLCSFHSINYTYQLLSSKLRSLSLLNLFPYLNDDYQICSIINLTISRCSLNELYKLFSCTPQLKYLHIHNIYIPFEWHNNTDSIRGLAINLQNLTIDNLQETFEHFKIFLKQIPNLQILTIFSEDETMIDAYGWHNLITTSLPYLKTFNFKFTHHFENNNNIIIDKFKQFQNSFWPSIEYVLDSYLAFIYTTPYMLDSYTLTSDANRYFNKLMNSSKTFNNVRKLILHQKSIREKCEYYFSNVESLTLKFLCEKDVELLKMIVNLKNLKHLNISSKCKTDILLEILKQSPQLSSLTINPLMLLIAFNDDELCRYLNRMIKNLDIYIKHDATSNEFDTTEKFCQVFSNLERLKCNIQLLDDLLFLLNNLPELSFLNVVVSLTDENFIDQFKDKALNSNVKYKIKYDDLNYEVFMAEISIWTG